jgi:C-terminal processing protease CtpA/Prc
MKILLAVAALILASPAVDSGCGWTGLVLAPPDVEVRGPDVRLERPLQVVDVEGDSPAEDAGMEAGMEILSLDGQRWDEGGFLANLVRLQTVEPEDLLRVVARDADDSERVFKLRAEPCSEEQARRRARTLANLGRMEGTVYGRIAERRYQDEERYSEAQTLYQQAMAEYEAARKDAMERLTRPEVQRQIEQVMRGAEEAMREAQEMMADADWHRQLELSMSQVREAMEDQDTRRLVEQSLEQVHESEKQVRRALEEARLSMPDEQMRAQIERAMREAQHAMQSEEWRLDLEKELAEAREAMPDLDVQRQMEEALKQVRESGLATRRLLEEVQGALPDEEARRQMTRALEEARKAMQGEEWRRQLEASLQKARQALEETRAHELELDLVQEQVRRALEDSAKGREIRRRALLEASEATRSIQQAGRLFRGASFQRVEPGISRHVGVDRGLLVLSLEEGSPLADAGVEAGDVIVTVDGQPVDDGGDLFEIVGDRLEDLNGRADAKDTLEMEIHSPSGRKTLRIPLTVAMGSVSGPL